MNIENYKSLLFAIMNSDEETSGYECPIIVYDIKNSELPIAVFKNLRNCGEFFNTTQEVIRTGLVRNSIRNKRFKIEKVFDKK